LILIISYIVQKINPRFLSPVEDLANGPPSAAVFVAWREIYGFTSFSGAEPGIEN